MEPWPIPASLLDGLNTWTATAALGVAVPETTRESLGLYSALFVVIVIEAAATNWVNNTAAIMAKRRTLTSLIFLILLFLLPPPITAFI